MGWAAFAAINRETKQQQHFTNDPQGLLNCIHNEEWILISVLVEYEVGTVATPRPAPILITG